MWTLLRPLKLSLQRWLQVRLKWCLSEEQAGLELQGSDAQATLRAVSALGLDETLDGVVPDSPSVGNIQQTLVEVQQQAQSGLAVVPAVLRVNFTEAQSGFLDLTLVSSKRCRSGQANRGVTGSLFLTFERSVSPVISSRVVGCGKPSVSVSAIASGADCANAIKFGCCWHHNSLDCC